jgi:hypothetical protein
VTPSGVGRRIEKGKQQVTPGKKSRGTREEGESCGGGYASGTVISVGHHFPDENTERKRGIVGKGSWCIGNDT